MLTAPPSFPRLLPTDRLYTAAYPLSDATAPGTRLEFGYVQPQPQPQLMVVYLANLVGAQLPLLEAKMRLPKLVSMQVFSGNVLHHMMWAE